MRQLIFYFFLIFILGLRAMADTSLPNPMTCGTQFKSLIELRHKGNTPASSYVSYFMKITFDKPGQFTYSSNWGMDVKKETIDGAQLQFSRIAEGSQKTYSFKDKNLDCRSTDKIEDCALSAYDVIDKLNTADKQLITSSDKIEQKAALMCAKSITLSHIASAYKIRDLGVYESGAFTLEALDQGETSVVMSRLEVLRSKRDAEKAKKMAALNQMLGTKPNSNYGSKRQAGGKSNH